MSAIPVIRTDVQFLPEPRRVIIRPFLPDERILPSNALLRRVLAMPEHEVAAALAAVHVRFDDRHLDLDTVLMSHFAFVSDEVRRLPEMSSTRCALLGAYYTHEVSIETAALNNPSIVPAPDQSGLEERALRFIISLRAIGEGHTSSIEFRSGVIDSNGVITVDQPSQFAGTGTRNPSVFDKARFTATLVEMDAFDETVRKLMDGLPGPVRIAGSRGRYRCRRYQAGASPPIRAESEIHAPARDIKLRNQVCHRVETLGKGPVPMVAN